MIKLSGPEGADPIEIEAKAVIGQLAIHRPVYRYMPHLPITFGVKGWNITHVPTGRSLTRYAPKDTNWGRVTLKALKTWAEKAQEVNPEAWDELGKLALGEQNPNPALGSRIIDALREA
jgi:hypothetical protein